MGNTDVSSGAGMFVWRSSSSNFIATVLPFDCWPVPESFGTGVVAKFVIKPVWAA